MIGKDILSEILVNEKITIAQLCNEIGLVGRQNQVLYDIMHEKVKNISKRLASAIKEHYPYYRLEWILTGLGDMFEDNKEDENKISELTEMVKRLQDESKSKDLEIERLRNSYNQLAEAFTQLASNKTNDKKISNIS